MKFILYSMSLFVLTLCPYSVYAQGSDFSAGQDIVFEGESLKSNNDKKSDTLSGMSADDVAEVTVMEDKYAGQYINPTVPNISKLYWKKNALSLKNNTAIDNFMLINECDIYTKFYNDDFEWERIRNAGRDMIKEQKEGFTDKFKMVIPIDLGRYDLERKGFPLINKTGFRDLRRVEIGGNKHLAKICEREGSIEHYPKNVILVLNKPFTYDFVELDEHVAQAFIIRQKYEAKNRPKELKNKKFDRLAFARIRITFDKYQGETVSRNNAPVSIMFGKLDGIDIFEDADEKRLLSSIDLR